MSGTRKVFVHDKMVCTGSAATQTGHRTLAQVAYVAGSRGPLAAAGTSPLLD